MSYLALARKWRPRTFSQLLGQDHVSLPLQNALNQNRIHHAYLFTGTRGVGKTSVARILAKALNCLQGISSEPCLSCDACLAIENGSFIDLIEIDGASKTRVEDTRELLDNVQYAPTNARYKIYLIDEVHMLSQHSFNALLKTLEEPPNHVKFILATTDPQKLPVTVLSRCLQFNLHQLSTDLIKDHLNFVMQQEKYSFEDEALALLAQAAQGSVRDALSLLDQAITGCSTILLASEVKTILGYTQQDYALQLLQAIAKRDSNTLFILTQQIVTEGGHFHYVLNEVLHYAHKIALFQQLGDSNPLFNTSPELIALASDYSEEDIQLIYQIGIKAREEINLAPTLAIGFNMTMLRMLLFKPAEKSSVVPTTSNDNHTSQRTMLHSHYEEAKQSEPAPTEQTLNNTHASHEANELFRSDTDLSTTNWSAVIAQLSLTGLALNAIENAEFISKENALITLKVAKGHYSLFTPGSLSKMEQALSIYFKDNVKIHLLIEQQIQASPAQQKERLASERTHNAGIALQNDAVFQQLQQEFSAEVVKNSISSVKDHL